MHSDQSSHSLYIPHNLSPFSNVWFQCHLSPLIPLFFFKATNPCLISPFPYGDSLACHTCHSCCVNTFSFLSPLPSHRICSGNCQCCSFDHLPSHRLWTLEWCRNNQTLKDIYSLTHLCYLVLVRLSMCLEIIFMVPVCFLLHSLKWLCYNFITYLKFSLMFLLNSKCFL